MKKKNYKKIIRKIENTRKKNNLFCDNLRKN